MEVQAPIPRTFVLQHLLKQNEILNQEVIGSLKKKNETNTMTKLRL